MPLLGLVRGRRAPSDFTENLEAVARGVRQLEEIGDPILREAVAAALRLRDRERRLDPASRIRMRNTVLASLAPAKPTLADRLYTTFALLGKPAPLLVRGLIALVAVAGLLGTATAASADSLPDDLFYGFKLAGEQLRLAIAISPEDRAAVELSIAQHRLDEAESLASIGREDDAIIATASYGSSLADAAAELATVESSSPTTAALVTQLQAALTNSQLRVAATAMRLAADPRTATTAQVLDTVSATALPSKDSPAAKIADQAAAITARLSVVADERAKLAEPKRVETPRATVVARTDLPTQTVTVVAATDRATTRPTSTPTTRPTPPAEPTHTATPPADPTSAATATPPVRTPPANASAARQSAEKAKEAAERALQAAEKAKHPPTRTPSPRR